MVHGCFPLVGHICEPRIVTYFTARVRRRRSGETNNGDVNNKDLLHQPMSFSERGLSFRVL